MDHKERKSFYRANTIKICHSNKIMIKKTTKLTIYPNDMIRAGLSNGILVTFRACTYAPLTAKSTMRESNRV